MRKLGVRNVRGMTRRFVIDDAQVLHGADSDIVWLQRDFGLYIVNMFDTGQAARVLGMCCGLLAVLADG